MSRDAAYLVFLGDLPESCDLGIDEAGKGKSLLATAKQIPLVLGESTVPLDRDSVAFLGAFDNQFLKLVGYVFWIRRLVN